MTEAAYFAEKALECRELAAAEIDAHAIAALLALAEELEIRAAESAGPPPETAPRP